MPEIEFKVCTLCRKTKSIVEFNMKSSSKDGLQNVCRICNSERNKAHYKQNKDKVKKRSYIRNKRVRVALKKYVVSYLQTHSCIDCGESDIRCLEFDHFKNKLYNVSDILKDAGPLEKLKEEIDKCEVRCANCHRKKTAIDFNWYKLYMNNEG